MKNFKDLSISLQKRRIVKDAIMQIEAGILIPDHGRGYLAILNHTNETDLQKILQRKDKKTCVGCAKGAIFAACVLNVDRVQLSDNFISENFQKEKLKEWFTALELDMIETAFEKCVVKDSECVLEYTKVNRKGDRVSKCTELGIACVKFGLRYKSPKTRLLAILENILANKTFKP